MRGNLCTLVCVCLAACLLACGAVTAEAASRVLTAGTGAGQEELLLQESLFAKSAVLMDGASGRVLYAKNGEEKLANASTTKILTCILALEEGDFDTPVKVSAYAASMPDVQLNIREGETYLLEDLLYSLMLESHNDVAVAIAEHVSGSCQEFAALMNEKAEEIGCENTCFLTPNGLDATETGVSLTGEIFQREHGATAEDLARIMRYCISRSPCAEEFLTITRTAAYSFSNQALNEDGTMEQGERSFSCRNHNTFLQMMEGALSGKTGFTGKAGYCYVGALKRGERTYIVALLACGWPSNRSYKWQDTKKLMEYGLDNFSYHLWEEAEPDWESVLRVKVPQGQGESLGEAPTLELIREEGLAEGILLGEGESLETRVAMKELSPPIGKGERVGTVEYYVGEELWQEEALIAAKEIRKIDWLWCLKQCVRLFFGGK